MHENAAISLAGGGDHFPADDWAFMARVDLAIDVARLSWTSRAPRDRAHRRETQYGWIELGDLILCRGGTPTYRVRRFREKSSFVIGEAADDGRRTVEQ